MGRGRRIPALALLAVALAAGAACAAGRAAAALEDVPRVVDAFESVGGWSARPADGVEMTLASDAGEHGRALRVDFRFVKGGGYAVLHRDLDLDLPENYRFTFRLRGECPPNNLEFKLVDSSGANVWWLNQRDFAFPRQWATVRIPMRRIQYAWGPAGGGEIRHVAAIELAVTAGSGGAGTIWLDDLELTPLPPHAAVPPPVLARPPSARPAQGAQRGADGDTATYWQSGPRDRRSTLTLDLQTPREFGGLVIDWAPGGHPGNYAVEASDEGTTWRTLRTVQDGRRARDYLYLPESESRFLRVRATGAARAGGIAIREVALQPLEWSATREAFFQAIAKDAPRGSFPRGMSGEQSYWTVVSVDGGLHKGLMSEDGAIETGKGAFSIEPFLRVDGKLITWADVHAEPELVGASPIPLVTWQGSKPKLAVRANAFGPADSSSVLANYFVSNLDDRPRHATLYLAVRPFQVNPPPQFLNTPGGTAPIRELATEGRRLRVNGDRVVVSLSTPSGFGAVTFDQGDIVQYLRAGQLPAARQVRDRFEAASGAFAYELDLPAHGTREVDLLIPLHGREPATSYADSTAARAFVQLVMYSVYETWERQMAGTALERSHLIGPPFAIMALRNQLVWILASRAGAALQPGTRAYARSWIRDGALISSALLRLGRPEPVREFIEWFAPYQYDDGKVPCCVDQRGSDPVPEHDSSGEFIFLIAEYYRYTGDRALVERLWPRVLNAAGYLDSLRRLRRTAEWRAPGNEAFFGLLPPSISHEGYSAKPMHSYWDDFFALRGFKDAATLAGMLGRANDAKRLGAIRDTFARDLGASVAAAMAAHHIEYVPGCADLGDFDATSTAIALDPAQAQDVLPPGALERTFDRYWTFFHDRRDSLEAWEAFTPYEMRTMGAFVRLGQRKRALEMLDYFLSYCRPRGWLQWPEVVWRDERAPHFLGDLPHAWVGAEYIRSLLDFFAYEREADQSLVVGAGIPMGWVRPSHLEPGLEILGLRTAWGPLDLAMTALIGGVEVRLGGGLKVPPGGIAVRAPFDGPIRRATVNGASATPNSAGEVVVRALPARVILSP